MTAHTPDPRASFSPIPVNTPLLNGRERELLLECIDTGWISSEGPFVARFEEEFSRRMGRKFGVAVANGSAALDVAVQALRLGPADEVIMPSFTIISPAASVVRAGAIPVLVDSDPNTWNIDVAQLESRITPRTRAILVVHIYGLPTDMDPILKIAQRHGLAIIEDAAEMHGQTYRGRPCGSFGELSVFSFYPNKHVTTDDPMLAERCRSLRNLCFQPARRFVHEELGWNYRLTNLQAALGLAQLERLEEFVARKRAMGRRYTELLANLPGVQLPLAATEYADNIYWVFGLVLNDDVPLDANEAMRRLGRAGVGTRPFFWPMHEQPVFRRMGLFHDLDLPVSSRLARRGFYLPSGVALSPEEVDRVAALLTQTLAAVKNP
jgi:perosamine synthetase